MTKKYKIFIPWVPIKTQLLRFIIFGGIGLFSLIGIFIFIYFYLDMGERDYLNKYCQNIQPGMTTMERINTDLKNYIIEDRLKEEDPNIKTFSITATNKFWYFEKCYGDYEISSGKIIKVQFVSD